MAGALKGPVCEKIIDSNYLIYAGSKNHGLSVYNPNEVTFLYYAFLKAQSYVLLNGKKPRHYYYMPPLFKRDC